MRKTISVAALLLALTCPAYAGEMQNDKPAPPPQPASAIQEPTDGATLNGDISTPGPSESLTQIALELLAVLPSLL
jgi:hypothetical protein